MTSLFLTGGQLPAGMMIRESPTKASTGRSCVSCGGGGGGGGGCQVSSFFDVFVEISLDNGSTWLPSESGPATMALSPIAPPKVETQRDGADVLIGWPDDGETWTCSLPQVCPRRPVGCLIRDLSRSAETCSISASRIPAAPCSSASITVSIKDYLTLYAVSPAGLTPASATRQG